MNMPRSQNFVAFKYTILVYILLFEFDIIDHILKFKKYHCGQH